MKKTGVTLTLCGLAAGLLAAPSVLETGRQLPVAYDVDVVVVGGNSAGVAAAAAAADAGSSVFLAAEQTYLGDDIAGTLRLALEPGEDPAANPLAAKIWSEGGDRTGLPFTYKASVPSVAGHKDSEPPAMLSDGAYESITTRSVEYSGPFTLSVDLGAACDLKKITLMAFRREGMFDVDKAAVKGSLDGKKWVDAGMLSCTAPYVRDSAHPFISAIEGRFRYLNIELAPAPGKKRILLGELIVEGTPADAAAVKTAVPRPLQVKRVLEQALLNKNVQFLFGCYPSDVLVDAAGNAAGIVFADRAGRQAVRAKVVIDATSRGVLARRFGAEFSNYPSGKQQFTFVTIGADVNSGPGILSSVKMPVPKWDPAVQKLTRPDGSPYPTGAPAGYDQMFHQYVLEIPMQDGSFASFANAEQTARTLTWNKSQIDSADLLFQVPPDQMNGVAAVADWKGAEAFDLNALRTKAGSRFYLLSGCASVSRTAAEKMLRPVAFMQLGERTGKAAAAEARTVKSLADVHVKVQPSGDAAPNGDVKELLDGIRPGADNRGTVASAQSGVPVIGEFDVVVVGGGTGGAPAAIAAAREGAKTLLIERFHGLGGVSTLGTIGVYCGGFRGGFTKEIDDSLRNMGPDAVRKTSIDWSAWNVQWKQEWYRSEILKAGGTVWFGSSGCGAFVDNGTVKGVAVATPSGRGIVLAKTVIDATGNSDIPAAAGAKTLFIDSENNAMQGTGLPVRNPYTVSRDKIPDYGNNDWTFLNEGDLLDTWRIHVIARDKFKSDFDTSSLVNSRERRRIAGEYFITPTDILAGRTYPDSIACAHSIFDTHGFTIHPVWFVEQPKEHGSYQAYIPYRSLIPEKLDGVIVCALGISAHRDALPVLRMQPDVQNTGYAAGLAGAMAAKAGIVPRAVNVKELQRKLVDKGCIEKSVLTDKDMFPVSTEVLSAALREPLKNHKNLSIVLTEWERALPQLQSRYKSLETTERTGYARMLGIMGDATGADQLLAEVGKRNWDTGWNFRGGGQFGDNMSELDCLIVALGRTGDRRAVPLLQEKMKALSAGSEFSHFRAVSMAAESLKNPALADGLYALLTMDAVQGWSVSAENIMKGEGQKVSSEDRSSTLRELVLARGLYSCGDKNGLGETVLKKYAADVRGYYSLQAESVLSRGKK